MSSITISPWSADTRPARVVVRPRHADRKVRAEQVEAVRTAPAGRVRLTRRGRGVVIAFFFAGIAVLMTAFGGLASGTFDHGSPTPVRIVEVQAGDTLYGLAGTVAKPGHVNDMIAEIEQLNSLTTPVLQVGQKIAIPLASK